MKTRVLDSWPILEWIYDRPAARVVDRFMEESEAGSTELRMSALSVGEVYYFLHKQGESKLAEEWREYCPALPVTIETPTLGEIWSAAELKARFPIAYADAFAAVLAQKHRCPLLTGNAEFRSVAGLELDWIGT